MTLAEELASYFLVRNYEWKFDYGFANPDEDDIQKVIDRATDILQADESDNIQLEVGRLIIKKRDGVIDVFVMAGTVGEEND